MSLTLKKAREEKSGHVLRITYLNFLDEKENKKEIEMLTRRIEKLEQYILVGESLVRAYHYQGLSAEKISKKSIMSLDDVLEELAKIKKEETLNA